MIGLMFFLNSCSKDEDDYVGKHSTYFSLKISLPNDRFNKSVITGEEFEDLGQLHMDIFRSGKDGPLSGECTLVVKEPVRIFSRYLVDTKKISLEMVNFRLDGDTLVFSLEPASMRGSSVSLKAKLISQPGALVLGLERSTFAEGVEMGEGNGPFFVSEAGGFLYFACKNLEESKETIHAFFSAQKDAISAKIVQETDAVKKKVLENSLSAVNYRMESYPLTDR